MNTVVMDLTRHALFGRRRVWFLLALPLLMLAVAALVRLGSGGSTGTTTTFATTFALGTLVPLVCLIIGTGVIAPEIEDGSIVYLLAKPLPRRTIALSKLVVAFAAGLLFAVVPTVLAVEIAGDRDGRLALAFGATSLLAATCYLAVFFMLGALSRNAVIVGLLYSLLWEGVLGGYVPGVKTVSVRQWALVAAERLTEGTPEGFTIASSVAPITGYVLLAATTVIAVWLSIRKLKVLPLRSAE